MKLADGEELISFEVDEHSTTLIEDPREELLEHRRAAEGVLGHIFDGTINDDAAGGPAPGTSRT